MQEDFKPVLVLNYPKVNTTANLYCLDLADVFKDYQNIKDVNALEYLGSRLKYFVDFCFKQHRADLNVFISIRPGTFMIPGDNSVCDFRAHIKVLDEQQDLYTQFNLYVIPGCRAVLLKPSERQCILIDDTVFDFLFKRSDMKEKTTEKLEVRV